LVAALARREIRTVVLERSNGKHGSVLNNTKIRVVVAFNPSALIQFRKNNEKLIVMILFNNGSGELGANARFAFL
jgi:pSer/pThr/pTyr-binding forkhead associated (FHA) protein